MVAVNVVVDGDAAREWTRPRIGGRGSPRWPEIEKYGGGVTELRRRNSSAWWRVREGF